MIIIEDCNKLRENWYWPIDRAVTTYVSRYIYIRAYARCVSLERCPCEPQRLGLTGLITSKQLPSAPVSGQCH